MTFHFAPLRKSAWVIGTFAAVLSSSVPAREDSPYSAAVRLQCKTSGALALLGMESEKECLSVAKENAGFYQKRLVDIERKITDPFEWHAEKKRSILGVLDDLEARRRDQLESLGVGMKVAQALAGDDSDFVLWMGRARNAASRFDYLGLLEATSKLNEGLERFKRSL